MWCNFGVEVVFLVYLFGDGFDDQIVFGEQGQMFVVIGGIDVFQFILVGQWCWVQFFQVIQCFFDNIIFVVFFCRKVEQYDWYIGVGEMSGNLCVYYVSIEYGSFFYDQFV